MRLQGAARLARIIGDANPLIGRELRAAWRHRRFFGLLGAYVALLGIFALAFFPADEAVALRFEEGRGRRLLLLILSAQAGLLALMLPALAVASVASERERNTLTPLLLTPLSPLAVLWGKAVGVWGNVGLMVLCSLPVASLCFLLGGVTVGELLGGYALLAGLAILVTGLGLGLAARLPHPTRALLTCYALLVPALSLVVGFAPMGMLSAGVLSMWLLGYGVVEGWQRLGRHLWRDQTTLGARLWDATRFPLCFVLLLGVLALMLFDGRNFGAVFVGLGCALVYFVVLTQALMRWAASELWRVPGETVPIRARLASMAALWRQEPVLAVGSLLDGATRGANRPMAPLDLTSVATSWQNRPYLPGEAARHERARPASATPTHEPQTAETSAPSFTGGARPASLSPPAERSSSPTSSGDWGTLIVSAPPAATTPASARRAGMSSQSAARVGGWGDGVESDLASEAAAKRRRSFGGSVEWHPVVVREWRAWGAPGWGLVLGWMGGLALGTAIFLAARVALLLTIEGLTPGADTSAPWATRFALNAAPFLAGYAVIALALAVWSGARTLAHEREARTLAFLAVMPQSPFTLWRAKAIAAAMPTAFCWLGAVPIVVVLGISGFWPLARGFSFLFEAGLMSVLALAWGLACSSAGWVRRAVTLGLCGLTIFLVLPALVEAAWSLLRRVGWGALLSGDFAAWTALSWSPLERAALVSRALSFETGAIYGIITLVLLGFSWLRFAHDLKKS